MIVLEQWRRGGYNERLVIGRTGHLRAQWFSRHCERWFKWDGYDDLPLFNANAQRKTRSDK